MTIDLWKEIATMFEADTGYAVDLVAAGPKHGLADSMKQGRVDLLTMHSSDTTTDLVADGFAVNLRPWAKNDLVILGPPSDPAKIAGMTDGAEALKKIAVTRSRYVELQGIGKRGLVHLLWKRAGVQPKGAWYMKDESENHDDLLCFVARHKAYAIFGRIPVVMKDRQRQVEDSCGQGLHHASAVCGHGGKSGDVSRFECSGSSSAFGLPLVGKGPEFSLVIRKGKKQRYSFFSPRDTQAVRGGHINGSQDIPYENQTALSGIRQVKFPEKDDFTCFFIVRGKE